MVNVHKEAGNSIIQNPNPTENNELVNILNNAKATTGGVWCWTRHQRGPIPKSSNAFVVCPKRPKQKHQKHTNKLCVFISPSSSSYSIAVPHQQHSRLILFHNITPLFLSFFTSLFALINQTTRRETSITFTFLPFSHLFFFSY